MDREQARAVLRADLRQYVESITEKSKGSSKMYKCPICGSGSKKHGTGAFSIESNGESWKCFSCGNGGDIFDLIAQVEGIGDYNEQLKRACEIFGINIDGRPSGSKPPAQRIRQQSAEEEEPRGPVTDFSDFFLQAHKNISQTDYPRRRGLSDRIIEAYNIGYIPDWTNPAIDKEKTRPIPSPRLIVPNGKYSYLARDVRDNLTDKQKNFSKLKVGDHYFFNVDALSGSPQPIFVVEGEFDALSILEIGGQAVALCGAGNTGKFISQLQKDRPSQPIIIAMDTDPRGLKASKELEAGLEKIGVEYYLFSPNWAWKDCNEALVNDRGAFERAVAETMEKIDAAHKELELKKEKELEEKRLEYQKNSALNYIEPFKKLIRDSVNKPTITTGFEGLDMILDGGLYEGLYVVGAISSLGKTTLVTQIADNIAMSGQDVLIFSLEMARTELMAKSISRLTIMLAERYRAAHNIPKTARGITEGKRYERYSPDERDYINKAIEEYAAYAGRIYIQEGIGDIGAEQIREAVDRHITLTGRIPVVIVDYLQILAPHNERATDKQNTDKSVLELKRISRDYKLPVIGISSFNRSSYKETAGMEAFKESGAIEYSSDVLIALQLRGAGTEGFDVNEAKKANPRQVELIVLKNRNGRVGVKDFFKYYPLFNYFVEATEEEVETAARTFLKF